MRLARLAIVLGLAAAAAIVANLVLLSIAGRDDPAGRLSPIVEAVATVPVTTGQAPTTEAPPATVPPSTVAPSTQDSKHDGESSDDESSDDADD